MRFTAITALAIVVFAPLIASAQYDFDDFLKAVESGQAVSKPQSVERLPPLQMPRLAQVPELPSTPSQLQSPANAAPAPVPAAPEPESLPARTPSPLPSQPVQPVPAPVSAHCQPIPSTVNFEELFEQQEIGLSTMPVGHRGGCQSCECAVGVRECAVMPYRMPNLPAPSTIQGYFNSSPCVANVWDGYSCDAAAECAKRQKKLMPTHRPAGHCSTSSCGSCP
jgi:hypothetical protein